MFVIQTKEFHDVYCRHVIQGGLYGQMAKKAATAITNLTHGLPAGVAMTNNGESRLRNCVKYALNDSFRLVTVQEGGRCFVLYMGIHDDADTWLVAHRNMAVVFNEKDQSLALVAAVEDASPSDLAPLLPDASELPLLPRVAGVDWSEVIPGAALRIMLLQLKSSDGDRIWNTIAAVQEENSRLADILVTAINHITRDQFIEAKLAVDAYLGKATIETAQAPLQINRVEEALRQPANTERFVVLNDLSAQELEVLLDPLRFQEWMVFLHEGQKRVVDEDFEMPTVLTGVSGSGKTCVLVHRAKRLSRKYPQDRILVLTLNKSLARLIENLVAQICSSEEKGRIDVRSYHEYLSDLIGSLDLDGFLRTLGECTGHADAVLQLITRLPPHEVGRLFQSLDELVLFAKFRDFLNDSNHQGSEAAVRLWSFLSTNEINADPVHYLYEELELIRSAFPSLNRYVGYLEEYERPGRSIAFQRNRREQVLNLLHAWEHHQLQGGFLDHMGLGQSAAVAIEDRGGVPTIFRYRCVLVDEFQDFSTLDIELLQKIPTANANGLFLTGDIAQKIYAKELNFPKAGMGPDERIIRSIRKNYRNTRQILQAGGALMSAYPPAVEGDADLRMLDPELANRTSALPIAVKTEHPVREAWRQAKEWLAEGNPGFSVCVATANPDIFKVDEIRLEPQRNFLNPTDRGLSFGFIEGSCLGHDGHQRFRVQPDHDSRIGGGRVPIAKLPEAELWRDAMRLYVAITRGRDEMRFPYRDKPLCFLLAMDRFPDWRDGVPFATAEMPIQAETVPDRSEAG